MMSKYCVTTEIKTNYPHPTDLSKLDVPLPVNKMMQEAKRALFLELPVEIQLKILTYLISAKDLCRVAQVSWHFYYLANDASLWKNANLNWMRLDRLKNDSISDQVWLETTFIKSSYRVREKIINTHVMCSMLWEILYSPSRMKHSETGMTFLFKQKKEVVNVCDETVTKSISESELTSIINDLIGAYQRVFKTR